MYMEPDQELGSRSYVLNDSEYCPFVCGDQQNLYTSVVTRTIISKTPASLNIICLSMYLFRLIYKGKRVYSWKKSERLARKNGALAGVQQPASLETLLEQR